MYERNAIVLERYFNKIFGFNDENNLKKNYYNYRKLFEAYGTLCDAKEREKKSEEEFNEASKEIIKLQKTQEKLYNKGAKFEYSRYVIFNNINENPEDIEKHLSKVSEDVQKNSDELKELGEKFVQTINDYNSKNSILKEATSERERLEKEYNEIFSKAVDCYNNIPEEVISFSKSFINQDNKDLKRELQDTFDENGKNEKNQFDPDVILNTINKCVDIYKIEIDIYLDGIERISKLFEEIETDSVKTDRHQKYYKDSEAKIKFVNSEKDYIVQFLDNERIGAIYDKKTHRKLMLEACKKFALDFEQIDKLYDIISKEIAGRSTKKIYRENYNKEYLINLENSSASPSLDTGKMRQEAIAFMNLNYWRVEGMKSVYNSFEDIVTTIYEKDLTEFIPEEKEPEKVEEIETINDVTLESDEIAQEKPEIIEKTLVQEEPKKSKAKKKKVRKVYYSSKATLANAIYFSLQTHEFAEKKEKTKKVKEVNDDKYSVPENVKEILKNVEEAEKKEKELEIKKAELEEDSFDLSKLDDIDSEEDKKTEQIEDDNQEDSILEVYFNDEKDEVENVRENVEKKVGLFKKLVGFNSKKKKEA